MPIFSRRSAATALLGLALAVPASAQPSSSRGAVQVAAAKLPAIHIGNFGRVTDTYFRGAQPKGSDYRDLAALGVKTVIDLTGDDVSEAAAVKAAGMKYAQIPMTTRVVPTAAQLTQFLKLVTDGASQPVYVHCIGGRHRTGVMTAVYRMVGGWTADQAFAEMKKYKFGADFLHPEFKDFVFKYPSQLAAAASAAAPAVATKSGS